MIRVAERNDIERIAEIAMSTNRHNFKNILSDDFLYKKLTFKYLENEVENTFDKLKYFVLEEDEIIIGYISIDFNKNDCECELINIAVDVEFQNKSYGTRLMDYCLEIAKSIEKKAIKLEVLEKNLIAIRLYEKYGFKIVKKYFSEELNQNIFEYVKDVSVP